jgi:hypothetical protein
MNVPVAKIPSCFTICIVEFVRHRCHSCDRFISFTTRCQRHDAYPKMFRISVCCVQAVVHLAQFFLSQHVFSVCSFTADNTTCCLKHYYLYVNCFPAWQGRTRWRSGWGTALQTGRSRDQIQIFKTRIFVDRTIWNILTDLPFSRN